MKSTKKRVLIILALVLGVLFCSCQSDEVMPVSKATFKLTSFNKEYINGEYYCKAVIQITGLVEDYSIDGLIYAEDITVIGLNLQYNEDMLSDVHIQREGIFYFNYYGKHKGNVKLKLEWYSLEDRQNYLVGWHLTYGYGADCEILMINLDTQILNQ